MQNRFAFEAVDRSLQDIRDDSSLFGGITTVLGGDFLQTLPIVSDNSESATLDAALLSSSLWESILPHFLKLETNMRVGNDPKEQQFAQWLRQLARGELNDADDNVVIPPPFLCSQNNILSLIQFTYPDIAQPHGSSYFCERCILAPWNREAREINNFVLDMFPGDVFDLWAIDEAFDPNSPGLADNSYSPEYLQAAAPSGFPPAHLRLKIGCPVIVLRNLHLEEGICNGTQGIVCRISTRVVDILLQDGKRSLIPRVKLISADGQLPFHLHRHQFPLALSFAITINKSQGQSFSTVGIDLRVPAFSHGQVYVAFLRGKSYRTIKCVLNNDTAPRTKNIIFRHAIL